MNRRELVTLLGSAAAVWPLAAQAQQPVMPLIGYLSAASPRPIARQIAVFRQGLAEAGYVEGRNVSIEFRFAEGYYDRLPAMAANLVEQRVSVIVATGGSAAALAAKAASPIIPIVFNSTDDPVKLGLVASLARPGGNATGTHLFLSELGAKQLGLLRELVPSVGRVGLLVNPANPNAHDVTAEVTAAASALGVQIDIVQASDRIGIDTAFATFVRNKTEALVVGADPFFFSRRLQLATLATRHAIPAVYNVREFAEAGGLMSYGTSLNEVHRQAAVYAGRILKGDKPQDLPVVRSTKFELVINAQTAKALGIDVPPMLLARADEMIE